MTTRRKVILSFFLAVFIGSFVGYSLKRGDFWGYALVGRALVHGHDIYLDTPAGTNTWPPFFSVFVAPMGVLDAISPRLARVIWIALTWTAIFLILDLLARMIYGKRLKWQADDSSLTVLSPELLVPFGLALPYIISNFELLQVSMILFAMTLGGLYLQSTGRAALGGIAIGAAAAMKVMAIVFLPYLLYRRRWRAACWMAAASAAFFLCPAMIVGWGKFCKDVALWLPALHRTLDSGNASQSVYAMWDRILGYGYIPFAVQGTFGLPMSGARSAKLAYEITLAIAAVLGLMCFRGTPRPDSRWAQVEWATVFVASAVLSPLAWKNYFVVLLLAYALLYAAWRSGDLGPRSRRVLRNVMIASFVFSVPTMHDVIGKALAVRLEMGSIVTYSALTMLGGLLWYRSRAPREELQYREPQTVLSGAPAPPRGIGN